MKNFLSILNKKAVYRYLLLIISLLLIKGGDYLYKKNYAEESPENIEKRINDYLRVNDDVSSKEINNTIDVINEFGYTELFKKELIFSNAIYVYKNDSLIYWSNNHIGLNRYLQHSYTRNKVVKLGNNWLRLLSKNISDKKITVVAAYLVKREFPFRNEYINNGFNQSLRISEEATLSLGENSDGINIYTDSKKSKFLFSIALPKNEKVISRPALLTLALFIGLGFILFIAFLRLECAYLEKYIKVFPSVLLFVLTLIGLRYLTLYSNFPKAFTEFELFQPTLYAASTLFPSLGDFMINILIIFYICYHIYNKSAQFNLTLIQLQTVKMTSLFPLFAIVTLYPLIINNMIAGLIQDSNINFNVNNLFDLSGYSILGITLIGILFYSMLLIADVFVATAVKLNIKNYIYASFIGLGLIITLVYYNTTNNFDWLVILWPWVMLSIMGWIHYRKGKIFSFNNVVLFLIIFSWFTAHVVTKYSHIKEWENRKLIMNSLATDEEPNTELRYADMEADLLQSEILQEPFNKKGKFNKLDFDQEMEENFFKGYWTAYDIQYYLFDKDSLPLGIEGFAPIRDFDELDDIIDKNGISSNFNANIYFIYNSFNKLSYVIKLPIALRGGKPSGFLFCELRSKKIPEDIGFPELLLDKADKSGGKNDQIRKYSFARYVDGMQVARFGEYNYSLTSETYSNENIKDEYYSFTEGNYVHMCLRPNSRTLVVMGLPQESFISRATTFSYLFTLLCVLLLVGMVIRNISIGNTSLQLTLQGKIQFLLVCVLLFSLVLFGIGTRYFISGQYAEKNKRIISEKLQSVRMEVSGKVGNENYLDHDLQNYLAYLLEKFSSVFITDINLYNTRGELLASSRPKIFTAGLLSTQMEPNVYHQLLHLSKSEVIQEEKIGNMNYLSGYIPLLNKNGKLIGFINLPYFSKQSVLRSEYSSFLVAIINIFILLFAISLLAALFVSNWITKPLRILQQSIGAIQLGKRNQPINYKGNDEIASLVNEYNIKVEELEKYAGELARSERESAWREMAKQVAHEIKNPLTPMRLTIQHAQRSLKKDDPDYSEKLERFTNTLIEQIDTLSHIANEFSNFAKMPRAVNEELDLIQILASTVELYKETPNMEIRFHNGNLTTAPVFTDKEQILRVTGNLVKNAIQAIPDGKEGKVDVYVKSQDEGFIFQVKDNGSGIDPEQIDKIFTPNFTTKSTGMGLGLAMVKNIVESSGGKIWFETSQSSGTSFFVYLPKK